MAKHVKKLRRRTAGWLVVVATLVVAGVSIGQLASASTSGATTTTVKGTTTTAKETTTTQKKATTSSVGGTVSSAPTSSVGGVTTTQAGGPLPFTGAAALPMLFGAIALLGLGAASLVAGTRRRRRA